METVNSLSGGKTSSYLAVNYPAEYNVFALVRTYDKNCLFPDKKIRQIVSDKIGVDFIGTLEMDNIIYTILDLEQLIGSKIDWVSGKTFDEIIVRGKNKYLPNVTQRFCTTEMKIKPIFEWWLNNFNEPIEMRIGYRANEGGRVKAMDSKLKNGLLEFKTIIGKTGNRNKWGNVGWQKPVFPLVADNVYKDNIDEFWKNKPVRFAYMNNCVGCFHRNEVLLKFMSTNYANKFNWFVSAESNTSYNIRTFKNGITYEKIKNSFKQLDLFENDFSECDSGYCGI